MKYTVTFKKVVEVENIIDADSFDEACRIADELAYSDYQYEITDQMKDYLDDGLDVLVEEMERWSVSQECGWYKDEYLSPEQVAEWIGE